MVIPNEKSWLLPCAMMVGLILTSAPATKAFAQTSFKEEVYPIIQIRCLSCHQPGGKGYKASGVDLRSYDGVMKGTKFGPVVVPGDALSSNLLALIEGRARIRMPHNRKPLSKCEQLIFRTWIQQGARNN